MSGVAGKGAGGRVFVSVDAEGLPFAVAPWMTPRSPLFSELRRVATRLVAAVAERLTARGWRVVVADSHGYMANIDPLELPRGVVVVRGFPRTLSMLSGARGASFAVMLGYHGAAGGYGVLSHTYSSRVVHRVRLNGEAASEYLLNAMLLGEWGVPVALVAGAAELRDEVERHTPWAVFVELNRGLGYAASESPSLDEVLEALEEGLRVAEERHGRGVLRPLEPVAEPRLCVEFQSPLGAEAASLIPGVERVDGAEACCRANSMEEAMKCMEAMVYLAAWAFDTLRAQL